jgi:hypothetical protein
MLVDREIEIQKFCIQHLHGRGPHDLSAAGEYALKRLRSELSFDGVLMLLIAANFDRLITDFPNKFAMVFDGNLVECKRINRLSHHRQQAGQLRRSRSESVWRLSEETLISRKSGQSDREAYQALWRGVCSAVRIDDENRIAELAPYFSMMKDGSPHLISHLMSSLPGHCVGAYMREYRRFAVAFGVPDLPTLPLTGYLHDLIECYKDLGVSETEYELGMVTSPFRDRHSSEDQIQSAAKVEFGLPSLTGFAIETNNHPILDSLHDTLWMFDPALSVAIKTSSVATILKVCHLSQRNIFSDSARDTPLHLLITRFFARDGITEDDFFQIVQKFKEKGDRVFQRHCHFESAKGLVRELAVNAATDQLPFDQDVIERICHCLNVG